MYVLYLKYYIYKCNIFIINNTKKGNKELKQKINCSNSNSGAYHNVKHTKIYSQYE